MGNRLPLIVWLQRLHSQRLDDSLGDLIGKIALPGTLHNGAQQKVAMRRVRIFLAGCGN